MFTFAFASGKLAKVFATRTDEDKCWSVEAQSLDARWDVQLEGLVHELIATARAVMAINSAEKGE